jgi:predicted transcriptional regulator
MDIQKIVSELLSTDLNQQQLADLVPCRQSLISAYLNGKRGSRPTMQIGNRLLDLHKERCFKKVNRKRSTAEQLRETSSVGVRVNAKIDRT